jgi:GTPase SAR1 family protein
VPTVFDTKTADFIVDGSRIILEQWDTAGQEAYEIIRPLSYPNTGKFKAIMGNFLH